MKKIDIRKIEGKNHTHYEGLGHHFTTAIATFHGSEFFKQNCTAWGQVCGGLSRAILSKLDSQTSYAEVEIKKPFLWPQGETLDVIPSRIYAHTEMRTMATFDAATECHQAALEDAREAVHRACMDFNLTEDLHQFHRLRGKRQHLEKAIRVLEQREAEGVKVHLRKSLFREQPVDASLPLHARDGLQDEMGIHLLHAKYAHEHALWQKEYRAARNDRFGAMGSKDELSGNSTFKLTYQGVVKKTLQKSKSREKLHDYDRHLFQVHHARHLLGEFYLNAKEGAYLANAVKTNSAPFTHEKRKCKQGDRKGKYTKRKDTEGRVPLSVEFICKAGTWHIHVAYEMPKIPVDFVENYAGVDLNVPSLAAGAYTPKDGLLWSKTFTFDPKATKKEKQRLFHQYVNEVVDWARQNHFGIALEYLEFEHAKRWLKTKLGSLLRIFPYRKLRQIFERRCAKMGVPLRYVNPRYTSLLGNVLGTEHPQLTRDTAAGCIIGLQATDAGNAFLNQKLMQFMLHAKKIRITAKNQFSQHVDCRAITSCQSNKALIALRKQGGLQHHAGRFIKQCQDALAGPERKLRHRGRKIAMSVHPDAAGEPIAHLLVRCNER